MQATPSSALRLRLLEPSVGVVSGGTRVIIHGVGFRPPPHSLVVRFRVNLEDPDDHTEGIDASGRANLAPPQPSTVDVNGRFHLETQLECIVPNFELQAKRAIAARTSLAASSASVNSAPQLVPLSVEILLNGGELHSNILIFRLHQPLEVQRVSPQSVLMASPAVTMTSTLNILKLPGPTLSRTTIRAGQKPLEILEDMSVLPVYVRVKQVSERTGAVSEHTREGRWKLAPVGVYEVEFDAVTLGFGAATVELSLNRVEFFRCKIEAPPEAHGYRVHRDVSLSAVEPPCISVTSGHVTEVRLLGDGFVDTGDLVVALSQKELPVEQEKASGSVVKTGNVSPKEVQVAELNATFYGKNEIRCTVPANLSFGRTAFSVSLNGGRQFGQVRVVGLLFRDRHLEDISPGSSSLAGGAQVMIRLACLSLEDVDSLRQLQYLNPPRRIRIRFQPMGYILPDDGVALTKVAISDASPDKPGVLICRTPSFLENIRALNSLKEDTGSTNCNDGEGVPYMWHFTVSVALGGDSFQGALPFSFYLPPVIRSLTQHHGPATGGTCLKLRMKHKVPPRLKILLRFSSLDFTTSIIVDGYAMEKQSSDKTTSNAIRTDDLISTPTASHEGNDENSKYLITCQTSAWTYASSGTPAGAPCLTIVQVSYDNGATFFPTIDPPLPATLSDPLAKDLSYLCFLFYPPPIVRTAMPPSADIQGGSYIRLQGQNLVDHGSQPSVIFESPTLSRKVAAVIEKGELRCCAPPFNVGLVRVFVSLNGEQYTLCDLRDPETNAPLEFIYYSSPTVTRISPLCACVRQSNEFHIFGTNLIETERIKVRVSFPTSVQSAGRRLVYKDIPGTARNGVITATTPIFPEEYANQNAQVDVALNGADFSGTSVPLRYFSRYSITRVDPPLGAFEVPVTLTIYLTPAIVTDCVSVRIRLSSITSEATENENHKKKELETIYGPTEAISWTASSVEFTLTPFSSLVESLPSLTAAHVELSFDGTHFHGVGNLREHYRVYNIPQLTSISPLFGVSDRETKLVAHGAYLRSGDIVKVTLFLESSGLEKSKAPTKNRRAVARKSPVPVIVVIGDVNAKRQRLTWTCPSLAQLRASPDQQLPPLVASAPVVTTGVPGRRFPGDMIGGMLLPEHVIMQISVVDGQPTSLPFVFRYYRAPKLVAMNPRLGYVCSGSVVSFEFAEPIATPTVDFRFGDSLPMTGRIRDGRFVECFSPELSVGPHIISISCNEQHFEPAVIVLENVGENTEAMSSSPATFRAFPLPVFVLPPADRERVYAFGPTTGGTVVILKGVGFVPDTKIYVRFASTFGDAFDGKAEIVVGAKIVDNDTIKCISPPCRRLGRVVLHVSYNLQQFSDSTCFFEYHAPTRYVAKETLCGPISGQTPLELFVEDMKGLPSLTQLLHCAVRFESEKSQALHHMVDIEAEFNPETLVLSCITPAWPSNELVGVHVSLARGDCELFEDTRIKFLFYDPPNGVIKIEPSAGPITGGTEVLAWCGRIVDAGEIIVSIDLCNGGTPSPSSRNRSADTAPLSPKLRRKISSHSILVKGEIVGEAVRFVAPPVDGACTASLSISLNGIDYTSSQSPLHFTYYVEPILRRINPGWAPMEGANDLLMIEGEHIRDFDCELLVKFCLQDSKQSGVDGIIVPAQFIPNSSASATDGALQCLFPAATPGFYELEVSLNGQQFSQSLYVSNTYGNLSGTACTALLPFRHFSSPFCLATATGPAAGGSSVVLFLGGKLLKLLARETKCQVQFSPMKSLERVMRQSANANAISGINAVKAVANVSADIISIFGEIDHVNARVTCRAPLLRVACVSLVDILLPHGSGVTSACQLYGVRPSEREKYYSYESPSINEIAPSCGPITGGTQLVIEGANILDTAQIFVRFRSSLNEREFVLVPGRYSRTFPGGSMSTSPLIICSTPPVEFVDRGVTSVVDPSSQSAPTQVQPSPRNRDGVGAGRTRTQTYQMLAEQSLKSQRAYLALRNGGHSAGLGTLRITRSLGKNTARGNAESGIAEGGATVLVDFTLNAGEQFIAHSVRFYYYQDIEPRQIKWSPRHLPAQCPGGRQTADSRLLTVTLPKAFRLTEAPERICFRFDGAGVNSVATKRRGSSIILHETDARTKLIIKNTSKIQMQSTMHQSSTYFKNSMLSPESMDLTANESRDTLTPPSRPRSGGQPLNPGKDARATLSSPCVVAKVISAHEVTCAVPDFSFSGTVRVFFSPNAQQFIYLGELLFHPAMNIKDEYHHTTFRFCSNVGGDLFALRCSPSTVLKFLVPEDIITDEKQRVQIQNLGLVKTSVALKQARSNVEQDFQRQGFIPVYKAEQQSDREDKEEDSPDVIVATVSDDNEETEEEIGGDANEDKSERWQHRSFHEVQVVLLPANLKLLKRVTVVVTRVDNRGEVGRMVPDDSGCCVFEMSNWSDHVLLTATVPASCGYSSYSTVIEPLTPHDQDKADNLSTLSRSYLLIAQIPDPAKIHIVMFGPCKANFAIVAMTDYGTELPESAITTSEPEALADNRMCCCSLDLSALVDLASDNCYACVRFNSSECELPCNGNTANENSNVQVLVSDCNGVQVCLSGPAVGSFLWVVARIAVPTKGDPALLLANTPHTSIEPVDTLVQDDQTLLIPGKPTLKDTLATLAGVRHLASTGLDASGSVSQAYTVPVTFDFTCADPNRSVSACSRARLVLSSSDNFQTLLALSLSPQAKNGPTVTLECSMPSLPFSGPATLIVSCGGVPFSNVVRVHCYDPRSWRVLALSPPCGQLPPAEDSKETQEPLTLRIKGEQFVENRKISVRVSDKDRYFTASGRMDQVHLLSVRIAAVKNLRLLLHPLGIGAQTTSGTSTGITSSPQKREDTRFPIPLVGATSSGGSIVSLASSWSTFTFTLRIECGDHKVYASCREVSVLDAISSGSVLSWEEEFELRVASDKTAPLVVTAELSDPSLSKPIELAQAWVPINSLQEGSAEVRRYSAQLVEHFKRGFFIGDESTLTGNSPSPEVDLLLQLSPLLLQPDYIVCQIPSCLLRQLSPQTLDVQVSSGDGVYSTSHSFQVYNPPIVTQTFPSVLPRTAGGDIIVIGNGFVNSGRVCVRLFSFTNNFFKSCIEEQQMLSAVNRVGRLQRTTSSSDRFTSYFTRYVEGVYVSATSLKFKLPAHLTSYNIYYSVSFDGRSFTEVSHVSSILLFSINAVSPKGGPISGSTYTTLQGTNIDACVSSRPGVTPLVRVTWKRGSRDLEHVTVPGECYPQEDAVYFYSPQSKFGLSSVAVVVELALVNSAVAQSSGGSAVTEFFPRFGRDEILFVMYKTPTIKSVAPLLALISGLSTTEVIVQGFDEKTVGNMRLAPKFRFKRRGQMQVSDAQLVSETRFECIMPRFNVSNAVSTELPVSALSGLSSTKARSSGNPSPWPNVSNSRRLNGPAKLWTRTSGIFVALLGARNLRASKKNACNPFAVVYVGKSQLKSTRKDGSFSPVWNELFDFEWGTVSELSGPLSVRVILESQLTADQSESLGHVELTFPVKGKLTQPFAFRAWIPVRRIRGKYARKDVDEATSEPRHSRSKKATTAVAAAPSLGEVELAIAFVPPASQAKKSKSALRSSIISVLSTHPQPGKHPHTGREGIQTKKEKLLRAFRQRGAPISLVPTELSVELALNGQDFWSAAPSTCYSILTPIVLEVEPRFISIAGGTQLHLSGINFVNSGYLRVAFAVLSEHGAVQRAVIVEAKYRSSTGLVCMTPSLLDLATEALSVNIYMSINGMDFDSIALPKQITKLSESPALALEAAPQLAVVDERLENGNETMDEESVRKSPRKKGENDPDSAIVLMNEQYVVDCNKIIAKSASGGVKRTGRFSPHQLANFTTPGQYLLVPQLRVYLVPKIVRVRPTDGIYTSHLTIDGANFTNTNVAIARFISTSVVPEVRTAKLLVVSSTRMECSVPDFPRGVIVRVAVAMNGVEFVQCPGELRVFQSPRLTEIFPSWISAATIMELELRGINLASAISTASSNDNDCSTNDGAGIQVSFTGTRGKKIVRGVCEDGRVRCPIPREVLQPSLGSRDKVPASMVATPILVDVWLGGSHNAFTGSPLPLHVYQEIPVVSTLAPMDGPVYGGFAIVVEGRDFIDTGKITVRFQLYKDQQEATARGEDETTSGAPQDLVSPSARNPTSLDKRQGKDEKNCTTNGKDSMEALSATTPSSFVDVVAKFVSGERVLCPAPSFPQEGVYTVLVALNGVEFSKVSDGSWFLAWQNWQKRKRLLSHAIFSRATASEEAASVTAMAGAAAASASLDEEDVERLRHKSSFMLPKIKSAMPGGHADSAPLSSRHFASIVDDNDNALSANPQLLQWYPTSSEEERISGRSLLSLLEYLCSTYETQQLTCRRLRVAFRFQSAQTHDKTESTGSASIPALRFVGFVSALRMIFPNATTRDLEGIWYSTGHRPDGTMTMKQLLRRLMRDAGPKKRTTSPEPGPTHYDPRYAVVSSRETSALILPPTVQPERISDPPSALFMDYGAGVQATKPQSPRAVFRKRKFNTSWCNPVVDDAPGMSPPKPRPPTGILTSRSGPRARSEMRATPSEIARATDISATSAEIDSVSTDNTDIPATTGNSGNVPERFRKEYEKSGQHVLRSPVDIQSTGVGAVQPRGEQNSAAKEDVIRIPFAPSAPITDRSKRSTRTPRETTGNSTSSSVLSYSSAVSNVSPPAVIPHQPNLGGSNPFYNDISPLYAQFLNSAEVQRFLKQ